jgi:membrane protein YqaA with SNARE-associated domain
MVERRDNTEQLLEEINTQLRHIKWVMMAGLVTLIILLLAVIGLVFFPVFAGLFIVAFLIVGPAAYLYHVFVATIQYRENRAARAAEKRHTPVLEEDRESTALLPKASQ